MNFLLNLKNKIDNLDEKIITKLFIFFCVFCAMGISLIELPDVGPDEKMKMDICKFIADYGVLPHGGDERIRDPEWGISYGFTPILSYIVGAGFIKIASLFTQNPHYYYFAARLVSVICYGVLLIFVTKIADKLFSKKLFKWFFIILIAIMPQVIFLGAYINNDSLAMMCISMIIYSWLYGIETKWNYKSCILLSVGLGLCALSYYNAYGYILTSAFLFLISEIKLKEKFKDIIKKGLIISLISFMICGWWFIRSAIIYNGDFLGLSITDEYSNKYALDKYKAVNRDTPLNMGQSLFYMLFTRKWITTTLKSFYGILGKMNIEMKAFVYYCIWFVWGIEFLGYIAKKVFNIKKKDKSDTNLPKLVEIFFWINIFITMFLTLYYSYTSDFQPQGRYIMPILIPFVYMITSGLEFLLDKTIKKDKNKVIISVILLGIYFVFFCNIILFLLFYYLPVYLN